MKLRTVDSPGVKKPKSKIRILIHGLVWMLIAGAMVGVVLMKDEVIVPYRVVLSNLCKAMAEQDDVYIQGNILHNRDVYEYEKKKGGYAEEYAREIMGYDEEMEQIKQVKYKIVEKRKLKDWDFSQYEIDETELLKQQRNLDTDNVYFLIVDFTFLGEDREETYRTFVYTAKTGESWCLISVMNLEEYEKQMEEKDDLIW